MDKYLQMDCDQINAAQFGEFWMPQNGSTNMPLPGPGERLLNSSGWERAVCPYFTDRNSFRIDPFSPMKRGSSPLADAAIDRAAQIGGADAFIYPITDYFSIYSVQFLKKCNWIDLHTRQVIIRSTFAHPAASMVGQSVHVATFEPNGAVHTERYIELVLIHGKQQSS